MWKSILVISRCLGNILDFFFIFWCKNVCVLYYERKQFMNSNGHAIVKPKKLSISLWSAWFGSELLDSPSPLLLRKLIETDVTFSPAAALYEYFLCKSSVQFSVLFCFSVCLSLSVCIGVCVCVVLMMREEVVSLTNTYASRANK